jgi:hypothetical protein
VFSFAVEEASSSSFLSAKWGWEETAFIQNHHLIDSALAVAQIEGGGSPFQRP